MRLITLLEKISNDDLNELPLKIRYQGKVYTKTDAAFTYYEQGQTPGHTLKIDTIDLNDDIEVFDDKKPYKIREKMRDLINKIDDLIDELDD